MSEEINIRNISIKCGNCNTYQTLAAFSRRDADWRGGGKHGEIGDGNPVD